MRVPLLDLKAAHLELRAEIDQAIAAVVDRGLFILGPEVERFESAFAAYVGVKHCIGVGNGLDALRLALLAAGVGPGDEVLVPGNTFIATWLAVSQAGARPVAVEPDESTFNLDPARMEAAITKRTRAVVPVHLYGLPADMKPILAIAERYGLFVLEDAAQAHGARYHGRRAGALANAAAWSFYPAKNLGALGDAGALTTDDGDLAERVRLLRNYGSKAKYSHQMKGVNSRLDEIQAAVLNVKLGHLDDWNQRRQALADRYLRDLAGAPVRLPHVPPWAQPSWHLFVVRSAVRAALREHLRGCGVETQIHYPLSPSRQPAYADLGLTGGSSPVSELLQEEVLSLPMGPHVTDEQASLVVESVRRFRTTGKE
jgi:dTDP-4-amino-4,6-dideoxygalactose transaminase